MPLSEHKPKVNVKTLKPDCLNCCTYPTVCTAYAVYRMPSCHSNEFQFTYFSHDMAPQTPANYFIWCSTQQTVFHFNGTGKGHTELAERTLYIKITA